MTTLTYTKIYAGYYKANLGADCIGRDAFANIVKRDGMWQAEIRYSSTGEVARFAGIWSSLRDAKEEVEWIAARDFGQTPYFAPIFGTRRGILATEG
jgi:hypothetical protein